MIELESSGHTAIYLDHNLLIENSYNKGIDSDHKLHFHPQLFDFKPKISTNTESASSKKRKRKVATDNLSPENAEIKQICDILLTKLKQTTDVGKSSSYEKSIPRIWEEPTIFPKFKGINATNDFQEFSLENKQYIIPPRCQFFNHDLLKLHEISDNMDKYDFVVMDPPWKNKYIRRIKKAKQELGYKMLDNDLLSDITLSSFIHNKAIIAVWCTNSKLHQKRLLEEFFPRWDLQMIHRIIWLKLNTEGNLIGEISEEGKKQPYEVLFIASHCESKRDLSEIKKLEFILSIPSVIHSHKPPITDLFQKILPENPKCLELFARYLQPGFTSIGLDVIKLMDTRLYCQNKEQKCV